MNNVVASDFLIAIDFGTNSPNTICITVMIEKLTITEKVVI
jgi:hypothetical protein